MLRDRLAARDRLSDPQIWDRMARRYQQTPFPGPDFAINGPLGGGARIFFVFYFLGTAIHGLHMIGGLVLVGWIILRAWRDEFSFRYYTPVCVVGLYWSFVDMVWIVLYPLIYLVGRGP
jgi:cytochrome c oxidase subunit 3